MRTPDNNKNRVIEVSNVGSVEYNGSYVSDDFEMVRPALRKSNLKLIDNKYVIYCGTTWIKIDEDLYIAEMPINQMRFDKCCNEYQNSEVRKFLLNWYEQRKNW